MPWPALAVALWTIAGLLSSYQTLAKVRFARLAPDAVRGRAIGIASAGLQTTQGLGVLAAGALAEIVRPSIAIGLCGAAGTLTALLIGLTCRPAVGPDKPVGEASRPGGRRDASRPDVTRPDPPGGSEKRAGSQFQ